MLKNQGLKAVAFGMICLYILTILSPSITGTGVKKTQAEQESNTVQTSDENALICGYVRDSSTGDPLANVLVRQHWEDLYGGYGWNSNYTNADGFYLFYSTEIYFWLYVEHENYFSESSPQMYIGTNQIIWYNFSLILIPPVTVYFYGFITNNDTGEPIEDVSVNLHWYDTEGHDWYNNTQTNSSGFYSIGSIPGKTYINVYKTNYYHYWLDELFTQNNSIIWLNISLIPYPPVSSYVCGFITDWQTGDPIPSAYISLYSQNQYGSYHNSTITNTIGFFSLGTIPGTVSIYASKPDYSSAYSFDHDIQENQTLWINLSLEYKPVETAFIQGYVVDIVTSSVIRNAFIRYDWKDDVGHFYSEYTFTDQKGYYRMRVPDGMIQLLITANGYNNQQISWFPIEDYEEQWVNTTLSPEITLEITKPHSGLYINNESRFPILFKILSRFIPQIKPFIIGPIEITVNITQSTMGCNRVEFSIDDIVTKVDSTEPFTYYWDATGFSLHTIQVIAYDNAGPCTITTLMVRKLS